MAALSDDCTELLDALGNRDVNRFCELIPRMQAAAAEAGAEESQHVLTRLTPVLAKLSFGTGAELVKVAGVLADRAPDPSVLLPMLVFRVTEAAEGAARFASAWGASLGDPPDAKDPSQIMTAISRFVPAAAQAGIAEREARGLVEAWFAGTEWVQTLLYLMQRKDVRVALPSRERLTAAIGAVRERIGVAHWLYGLLLVLDDEPLTVLHRPTGRGYQVVISGIGDNFQLHTLLAARLIGDEARGFLPGQRPSPVEIAAATDGPDLTPADGMRGAFNLVDAFGDWIWNEGRPADIPRLDGERMVVLDPPPYVRSWNAGRAYPLMRPSLEVKRLLAADEARRWMERVSPSRR